MVPNPRRHWPAVAGFTMIELMIAIVMLMIGVVAVAQLVPNAMQSNFRNRYDSTGLIIAQRQLEQMLNQPLDAGQPVVGSHYTFQMVPPGGGTPVAINIGIRSPGSGCAPFTGFNCSAAGASVVALPSGHLAINWTGQTSASVPAGYINNFVNTEGFQYETRWRVITLYQTINGANIEVGKRIIISTRGGPPGVARPPVTLTGMTSFGAR